MDNNEIEFNRIIRENKQINLGKLARQNPQKLEDEVGKLKGIFGI